MNYLLNDVVISPKFAGLRLKGRYLIGNNIYGELLDQSKAPVSYDVMTGIIRFINPEKYSIKMNQLRVEAEIASKRQAARDLAAEFDADQLVEEHLRKQGHNELEIAQWKVFHAEEAANLKSQLVEKLVTGERERGERVGTVALSTPKLRTLVALANHQVSGDEILKGLRAAGYSPTIKLQENFLGGWNVVGDSLIELLSDLCQRSE